MKRSGDKDIYIQALKKLHKIDRHVNHTLNRYKDANHNILQQKACVKLRVSVEVLFGHEECSPQFNINSSIVLDEHQQDTCITTQVEQIVSCINISTNNKEIPYYTISMSDLTSKNVQEKGEGVQTRENKSLSSTNTVIYPHIIPRTDMVTDDEEDCVQLSLQINIKSEFQAYSVGLSLIAVIGVEFGNIKTILKEFHRYIIDKGLYNIDNGLITLDNPLKKIIKGWDSIDFTAIPMYLIENSIITPISELELNTSIPTSTSTSEANLSTITMSSECMIEVDVATAGVNSQVLYESMGHVFTNDEVALRELDSEIESMNVKIDNLRQVNNFMEGFSADPILAIDTTIESQITHKRMFANKDLKSLELDSDFFSGLWMDPVIESYE